MAIGAVFTVGGHATARVDDPQITSGLHLYNIYLWQHVPEDLRTRDDESNLNQCNRVVNFQIRQLGGKYTAPPLPTDRTAICDRIWDETGV